MRTVPLSESTQLGRTGARKRTAAAQTCAEMTAALDAYQEDTVRAPSAGVGVSISAEDSVPEGERLFCSSFKGRVQPEWKNKQ